jgi:hypothetical protein
MPIRIGNSIVSTFYKTEGQYAKRMQNACLCELKVILFGLLIKIGKFVTD